MSTLDNVEIEGWNVNRKLVLGELSRVARAVESLDNKVGGEMSDMKVEIATIRTKVAIYAILAGAIASIVVSALVAFLVNHR